MHPYFFGIIMNCNKNFKFGILDQFMKKKIHAKFGE